MSKELLFEGLLDTGTQVTDGNILWMESVLERAKGKTYPLIKD